MSTTLESLHQAVESRCNSDEGLLRLVRALLEHQFKTELSATARSYVVALLYYAFHSRRRTIYRQSGKLLHSPCGINSGCGPFIDWENARDYARQKETELQAELSQGEIQEIKNRVGRLRLHSIAHRILEGIYETP